jgi:hypothetical protein
MGHYAFAVMITIQFIAYVVRNLHKRRARSFIALQMDSKRRDKVE